MIILPAIDLKGGQCVRLRQGLKDEATVYSADPVQTAARWEADGAEYLHVVDLDGAFDGTPRHTSVIANIVRAVAMPVEVGGGIRTDADVRALVECGVDRVILGTRAFADPEGLQRLVDEFGERLAVGIDARNGYVQVKGWVETTRTTARELAAQVNAKGIATLIYTDTSTDGMLKGHNVEATAAMCDDVTCKVIASGGVASVDDIRKLAALERPNLTGAIVGKALYDGLVTLPQLKAAATGSG